MGGQPSKESASIGPSPKTMENLSRPVRKDGRFSNPWNTWTPPKFSNVLKWVLFEKNRSNVPHEGRLDETLPIVQPNFDAIKTGTNHNEDDAMAVTWLGHASVLVQMDGVTFLTDPIFSHRASPVPFLGPRRYRRPPCSIQDLPSDLDAVLISHSHYDHLDLNSVKGINERYGSSLRWFIPLGLSSWLKSTGCENVTELDWWEETAVSERKREKEREKKQEKIQEKKQEKQVTFACTPTQHWSKRTATDDNKSLWGGWAVIGPNNRFFFPGDTGYCAAFEEIGTKYGPFTAAAIPIGAYEPRWFMTPQHVDPEEAVRIHMDIKSKFSIGIHWGTFPLGNEFYLDPPVKLREALLKENLPADSFITVKHGETRLINRNGTTTEAPSPTPNVHD